MQMRQYLLFVVCGLVLVTTQQTCTLSGLNPAPSSNPTFSGPFVYDISSRQNTPMDVEITLAQGSASCGSCGDLKHTWVIIQGTEGLGENVFSSNSGGLLLPAFIVATSEMIQIGQTQDVTNSPDSCKWAKYLVTAQYNSCPWVFALTDVTIYYKQTSTTDCFAKVCEITSVAFGFQKDVSTPTTEYLETQAWTKSAGCTNPLTYTLEEKVGNSWIPVSASSIFTITSPPLTTKLRVSASPVLTTTLGVHALQVKATSGITSVTQSLEFNVIACSPTFNDLVPNIEYYLDVASKLYQYLASQVVQTPNCGYTIQFEVPTEYPVATDQNFIRVQHGGGHSELKVTVGQTNQQTQNPTTTVEYDIAYYVGSVKYGTKRKSFNVTQVDNPCFSTSLIMPSLDNMVVQVPLTGTLSQTFEAVQDTVSNANQNPALCPERSFSISTQPALDVTQLWIDSSTRKITVNQGEFAIADLKDYTVTVTATYIPIPTIVNTTSFKLRVVSCETTTLENIITLLPMSTEALSAVIIKQVVPHVDDSVTLEGVITCPERTYTITTLPQGTHSQLLLSMVSISHSGEILVDSTHIDLTYVGDHQVTVTVAYTLHQSIFKTTQFTLTILDPCLDTQIEDTVILDLVSIQGNTVLMPFNYQLADTVGTIQGDPNFCGQKLFTLSLNQTEAPELNINSDQAIQFSPTTTTAPGTASCSLLVTMEKYTGINKQYNFMCTTIEAVVEQIEDKVYYVGSILQIPFKEFQIFPEGFYALSSYTMYYVGDTTQVSTPLDISILSALDEKYFTLDAESRVIKVHNNDESLPHPFFNLVLTNKIDQFVVWTQFKVEFRVKNQLQLQNTAPTFTSELPSTFTIDKCKLDTTALWSYKLPGLLDMEGDEIMPPEVFFQSDLIAYKSASLEFQQQSFPDKPTNISIEISVLDSRSAQRLYKFQIQIKICYKNITANISNYKMFAETIKKQQVHPQAQILRIRPDGLMTIKFSSLMSVPNNAAELQNATVFINETLYPALDIRVIPGQNSEPRLLKMNWTLIIFSPTHLDIQLTFENPEVISINNYDKDLIEMTIYGFQWFVDAKANFIEPGFKLKTKELPMLAESESASLMTKAGSLVKQGAMTILVTSVVLNILMAGPLQAIFDVVKSTQILLHLLLINVSIPATTSIFITQLIALMTYKVFDPNSLFIAWLKLEEHEPLSDQYDLLGYQSKYVILNLGSVCFSLFLPYVLWAVMYLVVGICFTKYKDFSKKVTNYLFFDKAFAYVNEIYFLIAMCASINLHYFIWDSNGDITNSLLTIVLLALVVAFPIAVGLIYTTRKNQAFIRDREQSGKKFMIRFGQIIKNLNVHRYRTKPIFYLVIGMIRKLWLVYMLVFMQKFPLLTILLVNLQTIGMVVAASVLKPYTLPSENHKQIMNEVMGLVLIYHLMALTDLVSDAQTREWIGFSLCSVLCYNLVVNLLIVFVQSIRQGCKRAKMHWVRRQNIKKAKESKDQRLTQEIADELNKLKLSLKKGKHQTKTKPSKGILKPSSFFGDQEQPQSQFIALKTKPKKDRLAARVGQSPSTVTQDGLITNPATHQNSSQELRVNDISESDFIQPQFGQEATIENRLTKEDQKEIARLKGTFSHNSVLDSETDEQQQRQLRKERAEFILNIHKRGLGITNHLSQRPKLIQQQKRYSDEEPREEYDDFTRVPKLPQGPDDEEFKQMVQNYGKERKHRK